MSIPGIDPTVFTNPRAVSADNTETRTTLTTLAAQFEAMLLMQMLRDMRVSGSWSNDGETDSLGMENFRQQFELELANYLSRARGLGLSQQLLNTIEKIAGLVGNDGTAAVGDSTSSPSVEAAGRYANARRGWNGLVLDMPPDGNSGARWQGFNTERAGAGGDPNSTKDAWYRWTRGVSFNPAGKSKADIEAFMRSQIGNAREYGLNILDVRGDQMLIEHWHRPGGEWVDIVANAGSENPGEVAWHWLPQEDFVGVEAAGSGELGAALRELRAMSGGADAVKDLMREGLVGSDLLVAARREREVIASGAPRPSRNAATQVADRMQLPNGTVTSPFGWRRDPITGAMRFHHGVDLRAAFGDAVTSAAAGRVVFSGVQGGYGTTVVLEHDGGVQTRYAHLSAALVREGESVQTGAMLGRAGSSGRSTGPHLHFEVTLDGQPADPASFGFKQTTLLADSNTGGTREAREHADGDQN